MSDIFFLESRPRTEYVTREVHEHRAPTDESIKLLREMEKEVENRIIESIRVKNTDIDCMIEVYTEPMNYSTVFWMIYSLNGRKYKVKHVVEDMFSVRDLSLDDVQRKVFKQLVAVLANDIAQNLLIKPFMESIR